MAAAASPRPPTSTSPRDPRPGGSAGHHSSRRASPVPVRRIETERLILEPVTPDIARAVVAGDFSSLDAAEGWPHDDTTDAMAMMTGSEAGPGWLITTGGSVIGDCGAYAWPDSTGEVQIGYGLAAPSRGHG